MMIHDKDLIVNGFLQKCLRFFYDDLSEAEKAELEEDLPEYAATIVEAGGYDLKKRIKEVLKEQS